MADKVLIKESNESLLYLIGVDDMKHVINFYSMTFCNDIMFTFAIHHMLEDHELKAVTIQFESLLQDDWLRILFSDHTIKDFENSKNLPKLMSTEMSNLAYYLKGKCNLDFKDDLIIELIRVS